MRTGSQDLVNSLGAETRRNKASSLMLDGLEVELIAYS